MICARPAAILVIALLTLSTAAWTRPGGGIVNTAHDFTSNASLTLTLGPGSAGLCNFCHTPHSAKTTQLGWNHTLSKTVFDYDVPATTAGTALPSFAGDSYKGPSAKCLSCHDGTVAIGDVGGQGAAVLSADKIGTGGFAVADQVGAGGKLAGSHPVAIPYPYGKVANTYNGITTGPQLAVGEWVADPTVNNIRLYSDDGAGNIVGKPKPGVAGIECSSCHDPHNKTSKDDFFLRGMRSGGTQASGYLCLQCHDV